MSIDGQVTAASGMDEMERRVFMKLGAAGLGISVLAMLGGTLRFFFPKVLFEPPMRFEAGLPEDYSEGEVSLKHKEEHRTWIIRSEKGIYALVARCTHLGCTPNWFPAEGRFKCPCHGSNFSVDGDVEAGPAPEPLFRAKVFLDPFGKLVVDKAIQENDPKKREGKEFLLKV